MRKKKEDKDKRVYERAEDFITHPVHIDREETSSKRKESLGDRIKEGTRDTQPIDCRAK
jgi:hypothetical protein